MRPRLQLDQGALSHAIEEGAKAQGVSGPWCLVGVMFLLAMVVGEHRRRARIRWIERPAADAAEDAEDRELGEALARLRHPSSGPTGRMWR